MANNFLDHVAHGSAPVPAFMPIQDWVSFSGMTRSATYTALGRGHLVAIRPGGGKRVLIDVERGVAWLRSHDPVHYRAPKSAKANGGI